jgi:hypothetical protein
MQVIFFFHQNAEKLIKKTIFHQLLLKTSRYEKYERKVLKYRSHSQVILKHNFTLLKK